MLRPRIGSLFTGAGWLDQAIEEVFGGTIAWVSEVGKGACKVLAHRYPSVPNLGDITQIDWSAVEQVDIAGGGSPCQDISTAGAMAGMTEGTRSNLWVHMREGIARVRPLFACWENVQGALTSRASSALESDPGLLGDPRASRGPVLRAAGRVAGDLASLGYDAVWCVVPASGVGACHRRKRVFLLAWDRARLTDALDAARHALSCGRDGRSQSPERESIQRAATAGPGSGDCSAELEYLGTPRASEWKGCGPVGSKSHDHHLSHGYLDAQVLTLPTPRASDKTGARPNPPQGGPDLRTVVALLPTPRATRGGSSTEILAMLPTPRATDGTKGGPNQRGSKGDLMLPSAVVQDWGKYGPAIRRQEAMFGMPAPLPTEPSPKTGDPRLSPRFTEWMMGSPAGWVTDVPGVTRNQALEICGNGVVRQQAVAAYRWCLGQLLAAHEPAGPVA